MTAGEWKQATKLSASDWPDPHTFIVELRDALGMFSGAMPISPKQAWEEALTEVERLRSVVDEHEKAEADQLRQERVAVYYRQVR